jgi:hypothetical protein
MNTAGDSYMWIYGIIKSCQTKFHFDCADILIELFKVKYPDNPEMRKMLIDLKSDKFQEQFNNKVS